MRGSTTMSIQEKASNLPAHSWPTAGSWSSASRPRSRSSPTAWHAPFAKSSAKNRSASACLALNSDGAASCSSAGDLDQARRQIEANPRLATAIAGWQKESPVVLAGTTPVATDDWPYIYLRLHASRSCITSWAALMVLLFASAPASSIWVEWSRAGDATNGISSSWEPHSCLLEVQNISKASVVLGNTWFVNAVVISGILVMVLVANLIVAKLPWLPDAPVYAGLFLICLALGFIDVARFGFLPMVQKAVLVGGVTSLPMLFSGILFARSFARAERKDQALGPI